MVREQFNARLEDDYAEAVHEFAEDKGLGKSVAARRLIVTGLRVKGYADTDERGLDLEAYDHPVVYGLIVSFLILFGLILWMIFGNPEQLITTTAEGIFNTLF